MEIITPKEIQEIRATPKDPAPLLKWLGTEVNKALRYEAERGRARTGYDFKFELPRRRDGGRLFKLAFTSGWKPVAIGHFGEAGWVAQIEVLREPHPAGKVRIEVKLTAEGS